MPPQTQQILQRVADYIASQQLLFPVNGGVSTLNSKLSTLNSKIYLGLSGGPDSVALLHILHTLGYRCHALHCNFHLRGAESDRDEQFCRNLCAQLDTPLQVRHFDTYAYMHEHHLSLEMAARELRYEWWQSLIQPTVSTSSPSSQPAALIALGHHQDDSIETLLMNLLRGTGIQGLTGIVPRNEATHVVRPLLCLQRSEILSYLADNQLTYVTDSTNLQNDTLRNQLRNQLLPLMEQILPQARSGILQTMLHLQGTQHFAQAYLDQFAHLTHHYCQWGIEWDELLLSDLQQALPCHGEDYLHYWQQRYVTQGLRLCRDAQRLYTAPIDDHLIDQHRPQLTLCEADPHTIVPSSSAADLTQCFDADTIQLPLTLRRYQTGDRMAPLGLDGHTKLLSDLFQNAHYSPMQKSTTWLVTDATGAILWVIGLRISHLHRVTGQTQRVLRMMLTSQALPCRHSLQASSD